MLGLPDAEEFLDSPGESWVGPGPPRDRVGSPEPGGEYLVRALAAFRAGHEFRGQVASRGPVRKLIGTAEVLSFADVIAEQDGRPDVVPVGDGAAPQAVPMPYLPAGRIAAYAEHRRLAEIGDQHPVAIPPDRIRAAAALAHDLAPDHPPLLQTVLGGKPGEFEKVRDTMATRLSEWARVAAENHIRLAVKAHAMNACDTPARLLWLIDKVNNPALTAIYDYGHFQLAGLSIEETMDAMLQRSAFITVKDSKRVDGKPQFLLPGDGSVDYTRYFTKVKNMGWKGWVLVEVTRQLQTQPGYDPVEAARRSYAHLAPILKNLGLR